MASADAKSENEWTSEERIAKASREKERAGGAFFSVALDLCPTNLPPLSSSMFSQRPTPLVSVAPLQHVLPELLHQLRSQLTPPLLRHFYHPEFIHDVRRAGAKRGESSPKSAQSLGAEKNGCCRHGRDWSAMIGQRHRLNTYLPSGKRSTKHCCYAWCMVCKTFGCPGCKAVDE